MIHRRFFTSVGEIITCIPENKTTMKTWAISLHFHTSSHQVFCSHGFSNLETSFSICWEYIALSKIDLNADRGLFCTLQFYYSCACHMWDVFLSGASSVTIPRELSTYQIQQWLVARRELKEAAQQKIAPYRFCFVTKWGGKDKSHV